MFKASVLVSLTLIAGLGVLIGCGGKAKQPDQPTQKEDVLGDWWNNPGSVRDHLAAVGASIHLGNPAQSRNSAAADGRAQLAATLKSKIQQLVEDWAKAAGDLKVKESLSSYINNETFTRQFVDTVIVGGRPVKYHQEGDTVYCLVILDTEKAKAWLDSVGNALGDQALRDATLWKTEAMKGQARNRLDSLIDKEQKQAEESAKAIMQATLGGA